MRLFKSLFAIALIALAFEQVTAQKVRNPKLSSQDLETAQSQTREAGGAGVELVYATRLDVIERTKFDTLVIVYAKPVKSGSDVFAFALREGKRYPIVYDKQGRALKVGDQYLRMGLKYEEGKSPTLRLMGAFIDPARGEMQRNVDFKFIAGEFVLVDQSITMLPK